MNSSRTCTCLEVYGENPDCPLHGVGTDWAMANPDICALIERAEAAESALRQANARIAEMEGWQPIETAPGGKILLFWAATEIEDGVVKNWKMATGSFRHGMTFAEACTPDNIDGLTYVNWRGETLKPGRIMPTHWRPLPEPPAVLRSQSEETR